MHMRSARRRRDIPVVAADLAQAGLCLDAVPDVLIGAAARAWWRHDHPEAGWIALGILVAAADVTGSTTMSDAFRTASRHPVGRPLMIAGWAILTAHLFGLIPPERDPINIMWKRCHV
jgi:hypothetical protein